MTGFSTPLLMQLLNRAGGAGGMPGSLAPQIPMLSAASRGAAGPVPSIPPAPQPAPAQNNLLGSLTALAGNGGLGKLLGSGSSDWSTSQGLFGNQGPLFGVGGLFGPSSGLGPTTATVNGMTLNIPDEWGGMGAMFSGAGGDALGAGAADAGAGALAGGTADAGAAAGIGSLLDFLPFLFA